ncbi:MAG TPA: nuclear transport factor 2 family protein [Dongiaceae bacterium]|nr:nuclear transport factor 2 family protein [Dongiaceae bacterium]
MIDETSLRYLASPAAIDDLRAPNALFIENFIRNDVKSHDAILHADFICVRSNGARMDRATYLERWATGFDPHVIVHWDVRDELITLAGNVALVRATNKEIVRRDGRDAAAMTTYTDTYLYERGSWKCIQAQITPVARDQEPGDDTVISTYSRGARTT